MVYTCQKLVSTLRPCGTASLYRFQNILDKSDELVDPRAMPMGACTQRAKPISYGYNDQNIFDGEMAHFSKVNNIKFFMEILNYANNKPIN
jgi:hypothetical protein